jgi:hypothetical protein
MAKLLRRNRKKGEKYGAQFFYASLKELHSEVCAELHKVGDAPTKLGNLKTKEADAISNMTPARVIDTTTTQLGDEFTQKLKTLLHSHVEMLEKPKGIPPSRGLDDPLYIKLVEASKGQIHLNRECIRCHQLSWQILRYSVRDIWLKVSLGQVVPHGLYRCYLLGNQMDHFVCV